MRISSFICVVLSLLGGIHLATGADAPTRNILFFSKSSGEEHSAISYKDGQPSFVEKVLADLGARHHWSFTFSKDGSKFSKAYLAGFDAVFFYTSGNLFERGTDGNPPMTMEGRQALFDYVANGKGFIGIHSAADTFHTNNDSDKTPERYQNHGDKADPWVRFLGGEVISSGVPQGTEITYVDPKFPGLTSYPEGISFNEEWYSLKDFSSDIHPLLLVQTLYMRGKQYKRPPYPCSWVRMHGKGRIYYNAIGHRETAWTNPFFQEMLIGGVSWALGDGPAEIKQDLRKQAPGALQNPAFPKAEEQ